MTRQILFDYPLLLVSIACSVLLYFLYLKRSKNAKENRSDFFLELEEERRAIASEIHDSLGVFLVPLKQMIQEGGSFQDKKAKQIWLKVIDQYESNMTFTNSKIYPAELQEKNLYDSLESLSITFSSSSCSVAVTIENRIEVTEIACIHVFRIVQETIVNAVKHCTPTYIQVVVSSDAPESLTIMIMYPSNEIKESKRNTKSGGRGQRILSERLAFVGGRRVILSEDGFATEEFIFNFPKNENSNS